MKLKDFIPPVITHVIHKNGPDRMSMAEFRSGIHDAKILAARALIQQLRSQSPLKKLADAEFKVFSQFGDDGIIQYLIHQLDVKPETFVEFGVENYAEANTRFLLVNDNWKGLVMDGSASNIRSIQREQLYWRHDLAAAHAFIDRDNINCLLEDNGFSGALGILSIDIDGNDYWVWERINVVDPTIVIVEYNSTFGPHHAVSIPYDASFIRTRAHYSNLYWGCSVRALCVLAERNGYAFVGCNSNGNNAYFVRRDRLGSMQPVSPEVGFVESKFRESRDPHGNLTFLSGEARRETIRDMPVVDVETEKTIRIGDLD